jgi:hypothetical protein
MLAGRATAAGLEGLRSWFRPRAAAARIAFFAALVALGGLGFIAAAGYLALRELLEPWQAAAIVGGAMLILSLGGLVTNRLVLHRRSNTPERRPPESGSDDNRLDSAARIGETLGAGLWDLGLRKTDVVIGALVTGTVLGASPELRAQLWKCTGAGSDSSRPGTDYSGRKT